MNRLLIKLFQSQWTLPTRYPPSRAMTPVTTMKKRMPIPKPSPVSAASRRIGRSAARRFSVHFHHRAYITSTKADVATHMNAWSQSGIPYISPSTDGMDENP